MRLLISSVIAVVLLCVCHAGAWAAEVGDTVVVTRVDTVYVNRVVSDTMQLSRYQRRLERYNKMWNKLIPKGTKLQFCGNMGLVSVGPTWIYGQKRHWETSLLVGFIEKHNAHHAEVTMTLKQDYIPWRVGLGKNVTLEPLTVGLYVNTVLSGKFWTHQPGRYPSGYYEFSTRLRSNLCVGQRLRFHIPEHHRVFDNSISLFYEISVCDYYIYHKIHNRSLSLFDITALSLGVQFEWL